jgi:hypothetical protein
LEAQPHNLLFQASNEPTSMEESINQSAPEKRGILSFRYITAEYRCTRCSNACSERGINLSVPYLLIALLATIPWSFRLFHAPSNFPWYYIFCVLAGELFLLFAAGLPLTLFSVLARGGSITRRCQKCGASLTLRGRHFTYSKTPHWKDYVLFIILTILNVVAWVRL